MERRVFHTSFFTFTVQFTTFISFCYIPKLIVNFQQVCLVFVQHLAPHDISQWLLPGRARMSDYWITKDLSPPLSKTQLPYYFLLPASSQWAGHQYCPKPLPQVAFFMGCKRSLQKACSRLSHYKVVVRTRFYV